ncbi:MAG: ELM1/GtrOC1 family putative glycosyltransferase, partial [Gammaproteobacteria bacterium]
GLPLMRVEPDRLAAARREWADRLAALPRPLVVLLVGGATKPYRLDADTVPELLAAAGHYAGAGGSIYISTSRRTGAAAQAALVAGRPANGHLYQAGSDAPNPYLALLDAGDAFVITGDSISMLTEAARLGRRIAVFDLPLHPFWGRLMRFRGLLERLRLVGFERNLGAFHQWLYAHNRAVPSGAALLTAAAPADDDGLLRVVARVRALLAADEAPAGLAAGARQSGTEEPSR